MVHSKLSRRRFLQLASLTLIPAVAACTTVPATPAAEDQGEGGSDAPSSAAVQLVMANYGAIPEGWYQLGEMFTTEHPDIAVEFEGVQAESWADYFDKLVIQFAAGTEPDIARVAIEGTQLVAHRGVAIPLDDYIEADAEELTEYFDDIAPSMLQAMSYQGRQYQLPFTWNGPVIHYNRQIFEEAGIGRPAEDWSVDEFLTIAQELTTDDRFGYVVTNAYWGGAIPWIFVAGSDLLNEDWTESRANAPETIEAIQFNHDLIWEHQVAPRAEAGMDVIGMFASGQLAMIGTGGGNNRLASINAGMESADAFDIIRFPMWRTQTHEFGGTGFPIMRSSPNPDAAWELTKFLIRRESIIAFVNAVSQTPARRSVAYEDWVKPDTPPEHYTIYWDVLDDSKPVPAPPEYNEIESIFLRYYGLVLADELTAEDAMNQAHDEISTVLANRQPAANP
jgi:ABC-type glycerol-3-phosphate transport system substrate-binding protein